MHPAIEALRRDLISLMGEILMANDAVTALAVIKAIQSRLEAALAAVEAQA